MATQGRCCFNYRSDITYLDSMYAYVLEAQLANALA